MPQRSPTPQQPQNQMQYQAPQQQFSQPETLAPQIQQQNPSPGHQIQPSMQNPTETAPNQAPSPGPPMPTAPNMFKMQKTSKLISEKFP